MSFVDKLSNITDASWYKVMMPKLYGWGASLVIIGALFKIEHWPFAGLFLTIGLTTEAIIFFFSAFEKPPVETDWSLVYPELANMHDGNKRPSQQLDDALEKAKIDNELIESLNEGLRSFGESAKQLNETVTAASAISEYNGQIQNIRKRMNTLGCLVLSLQSPHPRLPSPSPSLSPSPSPSPPLNYSTREPHM